MVANSYVVAIPTYNRADVVADKTLRTLIRGGVASSRIYLFVANQQQETLYKNTVPKDMYHAIVIGRLGIARQRAFISSFFPKGQYIVSVDDDVEDILEMTSTTQMRSLGHIDTFFQKAYHDIRKENLYIWGVYPVRNPFFMKKTITTDLRFIIGVMFGYINRKTKNLVPSIKSETKEDYEQTILYYQMDGGVLRYNYITPKTRFNAPGGLGTDRMARNQAAASYLVKTYPDIVTPRYRTNGTPEVRLARLPRRFNGTRKCSKPHKSSLRSETRSNKK